MSSRKKSRESLEDMEEDGTSKNTGSTKADHYANVIPYDIQDQETINCLSKSTLHKMKETLRTIFMNYSCYCVW